MMPPNVCTVTCTVAFAIPAALAVILAEPYATPVTGTVTVVAPAANIAVAGTVTKLVLSELRFTVNPPAGACPPVRFSVRLPEAGRVIVIGPAKAMIGAGTVTVPTPDV